MKNSLNFGLVALLFVVLGCSCPFLKNLKLDEKEDAPKPAATPFVANTATPKVKSSDKTASLTLDDYNQLKNGMSKNEVEQILGGEGEQVSSSEIGKYKIETYKWQGENFSFVIITFRNDKVFSKSQANLK